MPTNQNNFFFVPPPVAAQRVMVVWQDIHIHPGEIMKKTGCNKSIVIFCALTNIYKVIEINTVFKYREVSKLTKE